MLSDYMGFDVASHPDDLGGLRLIEWIRGYAVLQQVAVDCLEKSSSEIERAFPKHSLDDLEAILDRNGIGGKKARFFIDYVSFHKSSRDLFDAPILRGDGDWCRIAAPALVGADILRLVLSALANKKIVVDGKGEAFEAQFRKHLKSHGLPVYHFQTKRDGETYEYDAIVPWGDYVFVFECKSRSLSWLNPVAAYNLLRSTVGYIDQVKRLANALEDHPDILSTLVAEDCSNKTIIPVVLNAMPYSAAGTVDDVYLADASAVGRFFEKRHMHISMVHPVGDTKIVQRVPTHSQWSGETPTADDFMNHLTDPLPLRIMMAHLNVKPFVFQISPSLYAMSERPRRGEMTTESMAKLAGITMEQFEAETERFVRRIAQAAGQACPY
jgi:hypothetical protein